MIIIIVTANGHPGQAYFVNTNYRILRAIILLFRGRRRGRRRQSLLW